MSRASPCETSASLPHPSWAKPPPLSSPSLVLCFLDLLSTPPKSFQTRRSPYAAADSQKNDLWRGRTADLMRTTRVLSIRSNQLS